MVSGQALYILPPFHLKGNGRGEEVILACTSNRKLLVSPVSVFLCHFLEEATEVRQGEGEFSKLVKSKSLWKLLGLLDLPGSDPGDQSKVSFTY